MPKKERFTANPFPPLELSEQEVAHLQDLALHIADDCLQQNELYLVHQRKIDTHRWKFVKSRGNLRTYAPRSGTNKVVNSVLTNSVHAIDPDLAVILVVGSIEGNVDDCMFGIVNPTLEVMRLKASYVGDLSGAAVLKTIISPTNEDPFHSLVIKWMEIDLPLQSTKLVKRRDFVYMEATGFLTSPSGDRVGYHIVHSVTFPQTKPIPPRIRANYACVGMFRQSRDGNSVDVFGTGVVNPGGEMMKLLTIPVAVNALLSGGNYVYCGEMKKLAWFLQKRLTISHDRDDGDRCGTCKKRLARGVFSDIGATVCKICFQNVCSSCKVRKQLSFLTMDNHLFQRKVSFCAPCIKTAMASSAVDAARDELNWYGASSLFDTTFLRDELDTLLSESSISDSSSERSWFRR